MDWNQLGKGINCERRPNLLSLYDPPGHTDKRIDHTQNKTKIYFSFLLKNLNFPMGINMGK